MRVVVAGDGGTLGRALRAALDPSSTVEPVRLGDPLPGTTAARTVLVDVSSAPPDARIPALANALDASLAVVTSSLHPEVLAWARGEGDRLARRAGTLLLAGVGATGLVGGWLAPLAAARTAPAHDLHVTYALPDRGGPSRLRTPGLRAELPAIVAAGATVVDGGEPAQEPLAGRRRLAWFPRPVGPAHAATLPTSEAVPLAASLPALRTVHTYLALSSWQAELWQAAANASRSRWLAGRVARRLTRARPSTAAASDRWACVAEADGPVGVVRAWAYGRDPLGTGAAALAAVVEHLAGADGPPRVTGHVGAADVLDPRTALDAVARRSDLRWSVTEPGPARGRPHV